MTLKSSYWDQKRLDSIQASEKYSFVGGPFGSNLTSSDYVESPGVPVIRGTNLGMQEGRFIDDGFVFVSEDKAERLSQNLAFPGDIVFTQRGTLGQVAIIPENARFSKYVISQSQMKLKVDAKLADRRFVYYAFRSPLSQSRLLSYTQATGVPHINLGILRAFEIPLPPLSEQKRIADILDKADAMRRKRHEALSEIERLSIATYRERFGHPTAAADTIPLGECVTIVSGGTPLKSNDAFWNGNFPWVSPKDMKVNYIADAEDHVAELAFQQTTLKKLPIASVLIVVRGMILAHTIPVALTDAPVAINQDIKALISKASFDPYFICWSLKAAHNYMLSKVATAAHGTKRLEVEHIAACPIPNVPLSAQREFAQAIKKIRDVRDRLATNEPEGLFASLVQSAFKGDL